METQEKKSPHTLFWIAGIAVTVFSAAGIAAIMGWIPTSTSSPADKVVVVTPPAKPAITSTNTTSAQAREAREREQAREDRADARAARAQVQAKAHCAECGVIESVLEITTKGAGTGVGAVSGAVVGGVIGHQVGSGRGQDVATVVGAVGGAVAGHQIEKQVKKTTSYDITVRFEDGSSRVIHEANAPSWRVGDRVKIVNGVIQSNA